MTLDINPTIDLHRELLRAWHRQPIVASQLRENAIERLYSRGVAFEGNRRLNLELSALLLTSRDVSHLQEVAETLHGLVERLIDWLMEDVHRIEQYFPHHIRVLSFLRKSPGLTTWQGYSRYDAILTPRGEVKVVELNTGCPAGLLGNSSIAAEVIRTALDTEGLGILTDTDLASISQHVLVDALLEIEERGAQGEGMIAVLTDENKITNQLSDLVQALTTRGREAQIADATRLETRDGHLYCDDRAVSLTFNKFRISTANSPSHHWSQGFEDRYGDFLRGVEEGLFCTVNNMTAMTIGEDKSLLALFFLRDTQPLFSQAERKFLSEHVIPTNPLVKGRHRFGDAIVDVNCIRDSNRQDLVIKPANEGRGYGVVVGRYATDDQWKEACRIDSAVPKILQQYAEPLMLLVPTIRDHRICQTEMSVTLGLGVIRGKYVGVMSRLSTNPVSNVALDGIVQPAFLIPAG